MFKNAGMANLTSHDQNINSKCNLFLYLIVPLGVKYMDIAPSQICYYPPKGLGVMSYFAQGTSITLRS